MAVAGKPALLRALLLPSVTEGSVRCRSHLYRERVAESNNSERKRFGAAELKRTSERSEDVVNYCVFSLSLPKISFSLPRN